MRPETCQGTGRAFTRITVHAGNQDILSAETDLWTDPRIPDMLRQYSDNALVEEAPIFLSLGDIHLGKKLGEGTYGKTYTCTLLQQTTNVVVKMPLAQELQDNSIAKKAVPEMEKVVANYNQEFTNFERMMEPVLFTTYTRQGEHWVTLKTDSVAENHQEYFALQQEMLKIQGHPGYKHMHRLLHFQIAEGTVPLIFSEPCDETLQGLLRQLYLASSPFLRLKEYKLWWTIARQLTSAMEFMLVERHFVNVDIKPINVLYCAQDNRFVLADYGMCLSSEEPSSTFANQTDLGTHFYNPKTLGQLQNAGDLAIFQFAACMLCIVDYSQTPRPQCIELIGTHIHTSRSDSEEEYDHIHTASRWVHDGTLPITPLIASVPALAPLAAILKPGNEALIRPSFSDFQKQLSQVQE